MKEQSPFALMLPSNKDFAVFLCSTIPLPKGSLAAEPARRSLSPSRQPPGKRQHQSKYFKSKSPKREIRLAHLSIVIPKSRKIMNTFYHIPSKKSSNSHTPVTVFSRQCRKPDVSQTFSKSSFCHTVIQTSKNVTDIYSVLGYFFIKRLFFVQLYPFSFSVFVSQSLW